MKKNILKATLVAAFGLIAGFNVYNSQKSDVMSELALANVEALADDESVTVECPGGTDECARVLVGNTVHLFSKYTDSVSEQRMSVYNRFGVYDFCQCRV